MSDPNCLVLNWPPAEGWFLPPRAPETPEEEAAVYRLWIDKAVERGVPYVSLTWHPWSHYRFSHDCRAVRLTLEYAGERRLAATTYGAWAEAHAAKG